MLSRRFLPVAFLLPFSAHAQFSLKATQVGLAGAEAPSHSGICAQDACRAVIPVRLGRDMCALSIRVAAPTREGWGNVWFAAGPCQSGLKVAVRPGAAETGYTLDHFFVASQTFVVPLRTANKFAANKLVDDAVLHEPIVIRHDIIADKP